MATIYGSWSSRWKPSGASKYRHFRSVLSYTITVFPTYISVYVKSGINLDYAVFLLQDPTEGYSIKNIAALSHGAQVGGTPVPEPATMLLFGTGLAGLAAVARRRKN